MGQFCNIMPTRFYTDRIEMVIFSVCRNYVVPGPGQL